MSDKEPTPGEARDYRDTLFLPRTDFPMRAGLPQREPERLAVWEAADLHGQLRADARARNAPPFVLHDGPPYANGNLHIGTALNKILKDIVVRSRQMTGFDAHYVPGWDCHGLPIEWKVEEAFRAKGRQKRDVDPSEFRRACRAYAAEWIDIQRAEFKRLGVMGDWDDPYVTMDYASEAAIVREFLKVARLGQLKRGAKPVMWSPVEQTALAEAEIEYEDRKATTLWVKFPVVGGPAAGALAGASVVIWTTTPWTIPANRAVSFNPGIAYGLYRCVGVEQGLAFAPWVKPGDLLIVADRLVESVMRAARAESWERLADVDPAGLTLAHPFREAGLGGYRYDVPTLPGGHVTDDAGTGFVHTAPGHGDDDYQVWTAHARELSARGIDAAIPDTVDAFGRYTAQCPGFEGLEIIRLDGKRRGEDGPANKAVTDKLIQAGMLLARGATVLRDAHSWRSKAPVIRRATPQWFIAMDQKLDDGRTLRERALAAIDATAFTPPRGRQRIRSMVEDRPDWLISRQRAWGTPLTLFLDRETGGVLDDPRVDARILAAIGEGGADAWFALPAEAFLAPEHDPARYEKLTDILDVWFDSGATHAFVLEDRGMKWPADLYLEGSDQHRGWFQSSLLQACATRGRAPYDGVLTHGFVLAQDGRKMSKSLGNAVSPQEVCDQSGAEILRVWAASSDYWDDPSFGPDILAANVETYRKLRNTLRYLLGALDGFADAERAPREAMPGLERWLLHRLAELDETVRAAYAGYDFKAGFHALVNFCAVDLSAVYFDIRKDSLYCDAPDDPRRRACRTAMDEAYRRLTAWLAPVMAFTCEEAWELRGDGRSVHLRQFPETPADWRDPELAACWERIFAVREAALAALEQARREKLIGASLEAALELVLPADDIVALGAEDIAEICIVSAARVEPGAAMAARVGRAAGVKCARSWKYFDPATADPEYPDLTPRDAAAVRAWRAARRETTT
jgi:isoleucyl-tRNA synthetase